MSDLDVRGIGFTSQRTRDRLVHRLREAGIRDERVLSVIGATPRHLFVDEALAHRAYEDTALPIGHGQTISQPYVVARMTEVLLGGGTPGSVLEIGTGCGYQTAVLSQLVGQVYSVERIGPLLDRARTRLRALRCRNVSLRHADGTLGWPEKGPFDGILVTAAARELPDALLTQLAVGGRMVAPVGSADGAAQELRLVRRTEDGVQQELLEYVRFVPLLGGTLR
ncbi:MAG: protein-L-isoaspartate(D-aspartate) O-methyltransferase [Pseudomonadales bacterium]|jgi:protein-L-isoaspartate(D-aspartate) O-methyltransferase|nr:protein-L-isoaspartate(D-aspartate) O-methyltransferase [Pseudomonadales bacterium]